MMTQVGQHTPVGAGVSPDMSETAMQLKALVDHQAMATGQLVYEESRRNGFARELATMTGGARKQGEQIMAQFEREIASGKADLDETRQRIRDLRSTMAAPSQTAALVAIAEPPLTLFGRSPAEFQGAAGFIILFPLVLAASRWIWRRAPRASRSETFEDSQRFTRLEQAVESIAIEVERISESQRFAAKLLAERKAELSPEWARDVSRPQRRVVTPLP